MSLGSFLENTQHGDGSASQLAYRYLREQILSLSIRGGAPVDLDQVAAALRISRIPVRDAIRKLQMEGLVAALPNKRTIVTKLTTTDLREVFEMRAVLEGLVARNSISLLSQADFMELASLTKLMKNAKDIDHYLAHHEHFHDLVAFKSGMPKVRRELSRLREIVIPYMRMYGVSHASAEFASHSHQALLARLRDGKPAGACRAFVAHTQYAGKELAASVERMKEECFGRLHDSHGAPKYHVRRPR